MRIILGADHGGFEAKEKTKQYLSKKELVVVDVGAETLNSNDDYVDYAKAAVSEYIDGDRIVLFCRNGFGMSIVANRYKEIRCGLGFSKVAVEKGRNDDNINCLSIPADYLSEEEVLDIVETFINGRFSQDKKYQRRIDKIDN